MARAASSLFPIKYQALRLQERLDMPLGTGRSLVKMY